MSGIGFGNSQALNRVPIMGGYDAMASAYFAAVPNAFTSARKTIINTLIAGLRADGNLTKLDRLWLLANSTTGNAVIDIIGLNAATLVNAPAFVEDQGYTGDGATSYINSNYIPASNGVQYTLNSASYGIYVRTNTATTAAEIGANNGTNYNYMYTRTANASFHITNCDSVGEMSFANTDSRGFFTSVRTTSTAQAGFKNGVSEVSNTQVSTGLTDKDFYILTRNNNGVIANPSDKQVSIAFMGAGSINQATLYSRIQTYMTSIGAQV